MNVLIICIFALCHGMYYASILNGCIYWIHLWDAFMSVFSMNMLVICIQASIWNGCIYTSILNERYVAVIPV